MRRLTLATLLLLAAGPATTPTTYTVQQFRPSQVGDACDYDATATQHVRHTRTGRDATPVVEEAEWSVHLTGRCIVRAVDGHGACTTLTCKVIRLTTTRNGKTADLLPAGAIVEAAHPDDGPHFRRLDGPLPTGAERALALVLNAYRADAPTPDDVYPPVRPRAVGESWPMDAVKDAEFLRATGPAPHVTGNATLVGLATVAGQPCMRVKHVSDTDGPATLPGGRKAHRNDLLVSTASLPLAGGSPVDIVTKDTVDYDAPSTAPDGSPIDDQTHVVTDTHVTRSSTTP